MKKTDKEFFSVREFAKLFSVSHITVYRAIRDRRIAVVTDVGPIRIHRSEIDRLRAVVSTCDGCEDADTCQYAHDEYNTNGDCLAAK